jgi:hypothetical protein
MSPAPDPSAWHRFAWQGVRCETPATWELASAKGDARKGYCTLDDGEITRLQIRWQTGGKGSVSEVVDRYLKALAKRTRRSPPRVQRNTRLVQIPDADVETFAWHEEVSPSGASGSNDVTGLALNCRKCGRTCLLCALSPRSEAFRPVAKRVLGSFRDHPDEGRVAWSVLGFQFDVPEGYLLLDHALKAGRLDFTFRAGRISARAVRVGLAEIVLREQSLADWLKKDAAGLFPGGELTCAETAFRQHPAVEIAGRRRSRWHAIIRRSASIRCRAWHCAQTNAIYVARWVGPEDLLPQYETFAGSFVCHD